jgi:hypothetical protein
MPAAALDLSSYGCCFVDLLYLGGDGGLADRARRGGGRSTVAARPVSGRFCLYKYLNLRGLVEPLWITDMLGGFDIILLNKHYHYVIIVKIQQHHIVIP